MTTRALAGSRVALVLDDDVTGNNLVTALSMSRYLRQAHAAEPEVWSSGSAGARARCRRHNVTWRMVPHAFMEGSFCSWLFFERLVERLRRARPDFIVAVGPHSGTACALLWRSIGVVGYLWFQADAAIAGLDPRAARAAAAWTPCFLVGAPGASRALRLMLGWARVPVRRLRYGVDGPDWSALADWLTAKTGGARGATPAARFDLHLILRSVFPRFVELREQAVGQVRALRSSSVREVAIVGDGLPARMVIAECRRRSIVTDPLVPPGRTACGRPLDGVPRASLTEALVLGRRAFLVADARGSLRTEQWIRRRSRALGVAVKIFGASSDGREWRRPTSANGQTREEVAIERRASPIIAALRDARIREFQIYGASMVGRALLRLARRNRLEVLAFVDGNRGLWGEVVDGVEVIPLGQAMAGAAHRYAIGSFDSIGTIRATLTDAYREHPDRPQVFSL